jgi:hypothetical protein
MKGLELWNKLKTPPPEALKEIKAGRLKGKTDISPQWRYQAMTDIFGPCGTGWNLSIEKLWTAPGSEGQIFAFAQVHVIFKDGDSWSDPIPGVGGSMLIDKERKGLHCDDDAFKKAVTDATGTALKMIGVAADVYAGLCDSKHGDVPQDSQQPPQGNQPQANNNEFGF